MILLALALLTGCAEPQRGEDPSGWYDHGAPLDVVEPLPFTSQPYSFPANASDGIGYLLDNLFPVPSGAAGSDMVAWSAEDSAGRAPGCQRMSSPHLPFEIEGVVTIMPRYYFKTSGCNWDSDEKYYGSFFIQDGTGGVFVLGDSKVAHFDAGDRIRIRARAAKSSFGLNMIYAYSDLEIVERGTPIAYETPTDNFALMAAGGNDPTGRVFRVSGTVLSEKDTFGAFQIEDDSGRRFDVTLDVELNRRGIGFAPGTRILVTGPVIYSFSAYTIVIMRVGQITVED